MNVESDHTWLDAILAKLPQAKVAVFGDFCLDAYWSIDPDQAELSLETGLPIQRVLTQRYSLGGAGSVTANLADLGVAKVHAIGLIGADLFGAMMLRLLRERGVDVGAMSSSQADFQTMVYAKPCVGDRELPRIDFGARNRLHPATIDRMMADLDRAAGACQVVILNQQVPGGISPPEVIARINDVIARHPGTRFIVDSRDRADLYRGAILKFNAHEAARVAGEPQALDQRIPAPRARELALRLQQKTGQAVFVTRGERGLIAADARGAYEVPGIQIVERTDPVGAGDTVVAVLAAVLAVGGDAQTAAKLANIAASVTVRKLQMTGTASPAELRAIGPDPDYVYQPELADDPRQAHMLDGGEIELVSDLPARPQIAHAIFDHDGTISTLRQGWEAIMEPMMVRAILGPRFGDADEVLYHQVVGQVRQFIDKTTGVQTLVQMHGLVDMVRRFACVPAEQVLTPAGYKQVYNDELMQLVRARIAKLRRGELATEDFEVKGARQLLDSLAARGVKMYLASGTDTQDVAAEAEAMGYAHLFEGRIFGAIGDISVETKKLVMQKIIREHQLNGPQFVTFGDGPVEIRAARKCRGIALGVASDEVRRFGLNPAKRARLIRAGADVIVPDFSQLDRLLGALGWS